MLYVNVYSVGQAYGGREEGGWWYEVGDCIHSQKRAQRKDAERLRVSLEKKFPRTGRRTSVLQGEDYSVYIETEPGDYFPQQRPYYE
jgi:hypothetical protein